MTSSGGAAVESVSNALSSICSSAGADECSPWEPARLFSGFAQRLQLILTQLIRSVQPQELSSPAADTAFCGIATELARADGVLKAYRSKSLIYVLIHCKELCSSLLEVSASIAGWLALLLESAHEFPVPDLGKKALDLSRDMKHADFKVTENEERVYCTLQKEAEVRNNSKAVQSAIIMDIARALGTDPSDSDRLAEQIRRLRHDVTGSSTVAERRILGSLEKTFQSWLAEPYCAAGGLSSAGFDDDAHIPPFKNFLCPLTKEVMRDPVTVPESAQTYERSAIKYWFDRCLEDGREPTCPVSGQVVRSLDLKPNIGLAGAIEEWINRNVDAQVNAAVQCLSNGELATSESIGRSLDAIYRISEDQPSSRYKIRNAGIVRHVVQLLKHRSDSVGSLLRTKMLMVLYSMVKDDESKLIMLEGGVTRLVIRCLNGSFEKEKEYAVRLLLHFSNDDGYCAKLAVEKGALVLLSSLAGSTEFPTLSNLAEQILKNMEKEEEILEHLAACGRFQPLLFQLCEGNRDAKIKAASLVGTMALANNNKEHIARHGGKLLVQMVSSTLEERISSLKALRNLSTLDDTITNLVGYGLLPVLTNILCKVESAESPVLLELAASVLANIVSVSGLWELSPVGKDGQSLQSELVVSRLFDLLSLKSSGCQGAILQILYGFAMSKQTSESTVMHIQSCRGIVKIVPFLQETDAELRLHALRLANTLSLKLNQDLADELRALNWLPLLTKKLLDPECSTHEKTEMANVLANLPLSDDEIKAFLNADVLEWTLNELKSQRSMTSGRHSRRPRSMVEGLLGILLHLVRSHDPVILAIVKVNHLMSVLLEQLLIRTSPREKQLAVRGLKYLSESSREPSVIRDSEPQAPRGFCAPVVLVCGRASMAPVLCPLHCVLCEEGSSFCLLKGNAIRPLIDLMHDESTRVQIAAVEALLTLVPDAQGLKNAAEQLEQLGLFDAAVDLLKEVRPGELQEKVMYMVERSFREEYLAQKYASDQFLMKALIEALKHGNANTRRYSQAALTSLRQLSGVGGRTSGQVRSRRNGR